MKRLALGLGVIVLAFAVISSVGWFAQATGLPACCRNVPAILGFMVTGAGWVEAGLLGTFGAWCMGDYIIQRRRKANQ